MISSDRTSEQKNCDVFGESSINSVIILVKGTGAGLQLATFRMTAAPSIAELLIFNRMKQPLNSPMTIYNNTIVFVTLDFDILSSFRSNMLTQCKNELPVSSATRFVQQILEKTVTPIQDLTKTAHSQLAATPTCEYAACCRGWTMDMQLSSHLFSPLCADLKEKAEHETQCRLSHSKKL